MSTERSRLNGMHKNVSNGAVALAGNGNNGHAATLNAESVFGIRRSGRAVRAKVSRKVHALESLLEKRTPAWKRCIDISVSLFALAMLSPLLLLMALFIKIVSPGPVFFKQKRVGKMGKLFTIWKFRTMKLDADTGVHKAHFTNLMDTDDAMKKLDTEKDPRIIPFGNLLRQTGIDELPQLFNVLRGEMSIVGPRPCLPYEAEKYLGWQHSRFDVLPGLTGLWQVSGKNRTSFKEMMRLDITYTRRLSFFEDIRIMLMTVPAILAQMRDAELHAQYFKSMIKFELSYVDRNCSVVLVIP